MTAPTADRITWNADGLVPAVVQDAETLDVLMMAWMDRAAFDATIGTGRVHFWSRSRGELWEKGATSGHRLHLVDVAVDCDGDTLLVKAHPEGPACHTGTTTCWGGTDGVGFAGLERLWSTIAGRIRDRPAGSYTAALAADGPEKAARKVVEEATEVLIAAKDHATGTADDRRVAEEAADVVYHLLVLVAERGIEPALIMEVLAERRRK